MNLNYLSLKRGLVLAAMLAGLSLPLLCQVTSGNITGTVLDPSGASIPNAEITVTNVATGVSSTSHTTSSGEYRFENLPVGNYTVTASTTGFAKATLQNVEVKLNVTVTANLTETVGQAATSAS